MRRPSICFLICFQLVGLAPGLVVQRRFAPSAGKRFGLARCSDATGDPLSRDAQLRRVWWHHQRSLQLHLSDDDISANEKEQASHVSASRGNGNRRPHVYKHLYRYFTDICVDCWLATVSPVDFLLSCNYTTSDIAEMEKDFPRLLSLDVRSQLGPKVRFVVQTLGGGDGDICDGECSIDGDGAGGDFIPHNCAVSPLGKVGVPPAFFGRRLERTIAPRHGYLVYYDLPHGGELLENGGRLLKQFLEVSDTPAANFAHLCNRWSIESRGVSPFTYKVVHTAEMVEAFERACHGGLLAAARNEYTSELELLGCTPGRMVEILLQLGANAIEHDSFGASMLHWAAGTGNLDGARALLRRLVDAGEGEDVGEILLNTRGAKDGATPMHWACCGVEHGNFGVGGDVSICRLFLNEAGSRATDLVNTETMSGNTPLMWAAWSGSLDVVKLLISHGADPHKKNRDGGNAAHWAAAGGNLEVCKYLHKEVGVSFEEKSEAGRTPFYYAVSCGRQDVVQWIVSSFQSKEVWRDEILPATIHQEDFMSHIFSEYVNGTVPNIV